MFLWVCRCIRVLLVWSHFLSWCVFMCVVLERGNNMDTKKKLFCIWGKERIQWFYNKWQPNVYIHSLSFSVTWRQLANSCAKFSFSSCCFILRGGSWEFSQLEQRLGRTQNAESFMKDGLIAPLLYILNYQLSEETTAFCLDCNLKVKCVNKASNLCFLYLVNVSYGTMKTRSIKNKHRGLLSPFPPGQPVCEGSSGVLCYLTLVFGASHLDRALTRSVSTSQRQMGSLMRWCRYVRPATAAAPVCLYRSTERERECERELASTSPCVSARAATHVPTHTSGQVCVQSNTARDRWGVRW